MHPLYSVAELKQIEQAALSSLPRGTLMQRAGKAAADKASALLAAATGCDILVLAGPGNNGGDALDAAARLAQAGQHVTIVQCGEPDRLPQDAQDAWQRASASPAVVISPDAFLTQAPKPWSLLIDGLFGIGLSRPITGTLRRLIDYANALSCPVLALDVPSGLDADTGSIVGPAGVAVRASHTISFIADKPGLHTCDGRDYAGEVEVAALDVDPTLFPPACAQLNDLSLFSSTFAPRSQNSHKGSYGDVYVVGGAKGMAGAPILAARAAAHCGAGRVYASFLQETPLYDSLHPELMCRQVHDIDFSAGTVVAGPGLGTSALANDCMTQVLAATSPLVLDADALNIIATRPDWHLMLRQRKAAAIMTPHPLEAARLLGMSSTMIQADRLAAARQLAEQFNAIVVLKGSGSVIARPDGQIVINTTGNPALATAGTGDVLAGICGAFLAQHVPAWEAALAAVWLHGKAADLLVEKGIGPIGLTASELAPEIRTALNRLFIARPHQAP